MALRERLIKDNNGFSGGGNGAGTDGSGANSFQEMKSRLHRSLINRMDLTKLSSLTPDQVHAEVCRLAEIVLAQLKTPVEWAETLQSMAEQGADATPDEWRLIEQYIDSNLALIAINKAAAEELQLTMDSTPEVAAAIVKYRQANGAFKSVDDVKKVPGIDATKVDARRKRFVF